MTKNYVERVTGPVDEKTRFLMDQQAGWADQGMDLLIRMTALHIINDSCEDPMCMPEDVFDQLSNRQPAEIEGLLLYTVRRLTELMLMSGHIQVIPEGEEPSE